MGFLPEHDFQAQAQRWRLHIQQTPLAVIEWDMAGRVQSWNPAAERMFGYAAAEAIGQKIIELIVPPRAEVLDQVQHIAEGLTHDGTPSRAEHENRRKDGSLILCRWFNTPLTDEAGQSLGVASMALDVTELQRANQALRKSEERFRTVADFTHDWDYWTAPDDSLLWMSPSCERVTGYSVEAFQGDPELILRICHPEDQARIRGHEHEIRGQQEISPLEFRIQHRDGREVWISHICYPVWDSRGNPAGRRASNLDITERKQAERFLHESEQRFRSVFEKATDGIMVFSMEGQILDVNASFAQMHGRTQEELRSLRITDLNTAESNALVPERIASLLAGDRLKVELNEVHKDGHVFTVEATATQIQVARQPAILAFHRDITERKRAEAILLRNQAMLARTESTAHIGSWEWHVATDTVTWSDELFRILHWNPAEGPPSLARQAEIYMPESMARLRQAVDAAVSKGVPYELELQARRPSGEVRICLARGIPETGADGKVQRLFGSLQDITELKQAERALRDSEEKFHALFASLAEGVALHELVRDGGGAAVDYRILEVNPAFETHTGIQATSALGRLGTEVYGTETAPYLEEYSRVALGGEPFVFEAYFPPLEKHFRISAVSPKPGQFATVFEDITQRKEVEQALAASEARSRSMLQTALNGVVLLDAEGRILEGNQTACRMYGYAREEMLGLGISDLEVQESPSDIQTRIERIRSHGSDLFESMHRRKDGTRFPVEVSVTLLPEQGQMVSFVRDITERRQAAEENARLQAQLQQTQKMESLGTLAGGVAHDMNNALGAILGLATANLEIQPPGSPTYRSFETIAKAATRGGEMVRSLLSFARQSRAEDRELDLNAVIREEAVLLERTLLSKVRLELDLEAGLHPIRGDASALIHAFMNLCVNAVDAMPEQGTLTLRTRNLDRRWVEVLVEDTGTGMPQEVLARALDPFFTTKEVGKGTGLGLAMVYTTMKAHQGQLELHSEPGRGTQVRLRFPASGLATQVGEQDEEVRSRAISRSLTVLLVDDDDLIQNSIQTLLQALGHAAITAASGEEALLAIDGGLEPDAVILDMNMPGLGGSGTLPRLRVLLPEVPVLLSTGRTDQAALELAAAHSRVTLLPKPFSLKELQQHLEALARQD